MATIARLEPVQSLHVYVVSSIGGVIWMDQGIRAIPGPGRLLEDQQGKVTIMM
jgi:predicted oxidoreductase